MAYAYVNGEGQTYYLHGKDVRLKNGRQQRSGSVSDPRRTVGGVPGVCVPRTSDHQKQC